MTIEPQPLYRNIINAGVFPVNAPWLTKGRYEVLEEMFQMWFQAWNAWRAINSTTNSAHTEIVLVVAQAKKDVWEQAIMLYCGWNGTELNHWLAEKMEALDKQYV